MKVALALVALALAFALGRFTSGSSKLGMEPDVVINPESGLMRERSPSSETEADQSGNDEMLTTEEEESVSANDNLSAADLLSVGWLEPSGLTLLTSRRPPRSARPQCGKGRRAPPAFLFAHWRRL